MTACSSNQILLRVKANDFNVCSLTLGFNSHSHTVMQCQPIVANRFWSSLSLSLFLRIFATQNSRFVFGILQHSEFSNVSHTHTTYKRHRKNSRQRDFLCLDSFCRRSYSFTIFAQPFSMGMMRGVASFRPPSNIAMAKATDIQRPGHAEGLPKGSSASILVNSETK